MRTAKTDQTGQMLLFSLGAWVIVLVLSCTGSFKRFQDIIIITSRGCHILHECLSNMVLSYKVSYC